MTEIRALLIAAALALSISYQHVKADGGSTVIKEFVCIIPRADSGLPIVLVTDDLTHEVDTVSGQSILQCHFDIPEGLEPDSTLHHEGFLCATFLDVTTDSKSVTTKGGKVLLTCRVKR